MKNIFESKPIPNGHSWTITSKLGDILKSAEGKYGERDKTYTILGVEFTTQDSPCIWYPGNRKSIIIQITLNCKQDFDRAIFQVAHEAIHCLSPTGNSTAIVLEEGLATYFSIEYLKENGHINIRSEKKNYREAKNLTEELLKIDPSIIKEIREKCFVISRIDRNLLLETNSKIPENLAQKLTENFDYSLDS